ncbi:hypothetical protein [Flagellimonas algicola]|uniref:Uncharacterized protein n=1 Tax=Flagellimonas algicola TaxID=2583815 RepID=A0ABY2WH16_9FLAO|nr:hypothetical protein [Allomuricauda algicola]TMU50683.1 hypothetical protein FGG15_17940 [Allomuricauda algicola]
MQKEIQVFLNAVEKVLNGHTFFITFDNYVDRSEIEDKSLIKNAVLSKEFDLKLLEADLNHHDGVFFHSPTDNGKLVPKVDGFLKKSPSISSLNSPDAIDYLVSMLTTTGATNTFWSPYKTQMGNRKAECVTNSFLAVLGSKNGLRFYKLETNFVFDSVGFWDHLGSDSITAILTKKRLFFLFTNGGD